MWRALMWLNLYGHEAVRYKLKNRQKMLFLCVFLGCFWQFLSLCLTASRPYRLSHINALRINHCLNKRKHPLHSKVTSISYGWVVRSSKIMLSTFSIRRVTFKVAFFNNFGAIYHIITPSTDNSRCKIKTNVRIFFKKCQNEETQS